MTEHRWPPQPGDLVKVERSTWHRVDAARALIGRIVRVEDVGPDFAIVEGDWCFNLSDLSPATLPQTIEQFGRTYRLVEEGRTDTERLDWIEDCDATVSCVSCGWSVFVSDIQWSCMEETARAAIDAAMSATKGTTP